MKKLYKVGIYCRLSVDDASNSAKAKNYIPADESVSIENQYKLLSKFVMLNGWTEVKSYRDDGYSGGNFQRPGFLEMLEDGFAGFLDSLGDDAMKAEYLLPKIIDKLLAEQKARVKVLETGDRWFGVTYKEDKQTVIDSFAKLVADGVYQKNLFSDLKH